MVDGGAAEYNAALSLGVFGLRDDFSRPGVEFGLSGFGIKIAVVRNDTANAPNDMTSKPYLARLSLTYFVSVDSLSTFIENTAQAMTENKIVINMRHITVHF